MILLSSQSETRFRWLVTLAFYSLKTMGLAPFSHRLKTRVKNSSETRAVRGFRISKLGLAYNVVVLALLLPISGFQLASTARRDIRKFPKRTLDLVRQISYLLAATCAIISSTFWQSNAVSVMNRLLEVDRVLCGVEDQPLANKRTLVFPILRVIVKAILWTPWLVVPRKYDVWELFVSTVHYWHIVQYSLVLGLLARDFERVNNSLLKLDKFPDHSTREPFINGQPVFSHSTKTHLNITKLLLTTRSTLYEVSRDVADFFSFSILASIGCSTYLFIVLSYFCYSELIYLKSFFSGYIFANLSLMIVIGYPVAMLSLNVSKAVKEAKLTRRIINKLSASATRRNIREELQEYSLQLLHEDLTYSAHGLFTLDCSMLHSILETTVAYLVLLLET